MASQNAAQFGSSARAPWMNSSLCSEACCSSSVASQISAMSWCGSGGTPTSAPNSIRVSTR
jgi:hypothetical protein